MQFTNSKSKFIHADRESFNYDSDEAIELAFLCKLLTYCIEHSENKNKLKE